MVDVLITVVVALVTTLVTVYSQDRLSGFLHKNQRKREYENSEFPTIVQCGRHDDKYIKDLWKKPNPINQIKIVVKLEKKNDREFASEKDIFYQECSEEELDVKNDLESLDHCEELKIIAIENNTRKTFNLIRITCLGESYSPIEFSNLDSKVLTSNTNMIIVIKGYKSDLSNMVLLDQSNYIVFDFTSVRIGDSSKRSTHLANSFLNRYS
ncbi:hypothetical protein LNN31_08380 [Acetobacterium wieringae]|uniref:Uncharacterized protein n=1 Tax=Acetobacterium wieringae TaxID=52694 RepID=A0ABY6HJG0_9FIRM|nr:hypothetical protein [Acetobacterium wieringae]UYO64425.1 hypothetical protein LNN31_08380 [Acetobacterium wieringae]VUZ26165.1 Uncharacterised protein [Acetobacterium wieringae]